MKKIYCTLLLTIVSVFGYAQSEKQELLPPPEADGNAIYNTAGIEKKPDYPGGLSEFYKYIGKNYKTPDVKGLQGKVFITFVIEKDGSITDIKVLRDIGYGTGQEAIRVLKNCKKWIPGEQLGKKVRVLYTLPISIQTP